jgi:uncharacterized LabA/DUF88 family protein
MASIRASQGNGSSKGQIPLSDNSAPVEINPDRIAIFIDGANLFYAALQMQIEVDYGKLLAVLTQGRQLLRAYFYTGVDRHNDKQQGFILWMQRHGYRIVTKDLTAMADGSKKANLAVEIAIDMMVLAHHCDTIILLSGDGDLTYAINSIIYQGMHVEVVGLRSMTSDSLVTVADRYIDLAQLKPRISKTP